MSKRIFADFSHKTLVPSPDTYFKEEQNRSALTGRCEVKGAAFNSPLNSQHTFRGVRTFHPSPPRFDFNIDLKDSMKPAPTSYNTLVSPRKQTISHMQKK